MDLQIKGKWALVCGASRGLGLGCAEALVREGVHVLIVARREAVLSEAAQPKPSPRLAPQTRAHLPLICKSIVYLL